MFLVGFDDPTEPVFLSDSTMPLQNVFTAFLLNLNNDNNIFMSLDFFKERISFFLRRGNIKKKFGMFFNNIPKNSIFIPVRKVIISKVTFRQNRDLSLFVNFQNRANQLPLSMGCFHLRSNVTERRKLLFKS